MSSTDPTAQERMVEFALCERFGWTIEELHNQPYEIIQDFITIMNEQARKIIHESKHGHS